jgi:hypothetical protein
MKTYVYRALASLLLIAVGFSASASILRQVSYQGILTDDAGQHLIGPHNLSFAIYADSSSTQALWVEAHPGVPIDDGLFNVILGGTVAFPDALFGTAPRWMGVTVDADVEMRPRTQITSVPWAFRTALADSSIAVPSHNHDSRYYTMPQLNTPGTINSPSNPVDWTKLKGVPAGFADGTDDGAGGADNDWTVVGNNLYSTPSGNVGIKTTTPRYPLHVMNPADSAYAYAIYGEASSTGSTAYHDGVVGINRGTGTNGSGVFGFASGTSGSVDGVGGRTNCPTGHGVLGVAAHTSGVNFGIFGQTLSSSGYAGYFLGGRNYFEGNVGIGTATPASRLEVAGTAKVNGLTMPTGAANNYVLTSDGTGTGTWRAPQATPDGDWVIGDNAMYSAEYEFVGIGTATPTAALHVFGYDPVVIVDGQSGGYTQSTLTFATAGAAKWGWLIPGGGANFALWHWPAPSGKYMEFDGVSGNIYLANATTGHVGIGNPYPTAKLDVDNTAPGGTAVAGAVSAASGIGIAVRGWSHSNEGFAGYFDGGRNYFEGNVGIGIVNPAYKLDVVGDANISGTARVGVLTITGADVAEKFTVRGAVEPGMVVAIDPEQPGELCVARGEYNRRVAGVISGAGGLAAGAILGNLPGQEKGIAVALSGRVWVRSDASMAPIEPGDLLTTSARPGLAMKVGDYARAQGATLGKAMTALPSGEGLVLVLVGLQ